jgi:hypothetical protein
VVKSGVIRKGGVSYLGKSYSPNCGTVAETGEELGSGGEPEANQRERMADSRVELKTQGRRSAGNGVEGKTLKTGQESRITGQDVWQVMGRREREVTRRPKGNRR